ncbi:unnamed protein product [Closterium sp. Naga37s-1]|nr:unnamed protein product [Closterium sp. Naga37s-1]
MQHCELQLVTQAGEGAHCLHRGVHAGRNGNSGAVEGKDTGWEGSGGEGGGEEEEEKTREGKRNGGRVKGKTRKMGGKRGGGWGGGGGRDGGGEKEVRGGGWQDGLRSKFRRGKRDWGTGEREKEARVDRGNGRIAQLGLQMNSTWAAATEAEAMPSDACPFCHAASLPPCTTPDLAALHPTLPCSCSRRFGGCWCCCLNDSFDWVSPTPWLLRTMHLPYLHLPYLHLPYLHLPYLHLPYLHLPYLHLPYLHLPYLHLPFLHLPYLHLPYLHLPFLHLPFLHLPFLHLRLPLSRFSTCPRAFTRRCLLASAPPAAARSFTAP